jgi:threonine dehydrogenase-like Zn-dependent dehydrogenase
LLIATRLVGYFRPACSSRTQTQNNEYVGVVEKAGADVSTIRPGQFVIGSFFASDNTCEICRAGRQISCLHREFVGAGGPRPSPARPSTTHPPRHPDLPSDGLVPSLLTASHALGTGWFGAVTAHAGEPGACFVMEDHPRSRTAHVVPVGNYVSGLSISLPRAA